MLPERSEHEPEIVPGHRAASSRLRGARGSIFAAFDNLACGFDHEQAEAYIAGSLHFQTLPEDQQGKVLGLALGFALTAVESDRQLRHHGRWFSWGR
ncbi:MAG: hypothetical protein QOJ29_710 [Thermoleophilaceae bacterium]|jgi:hypothetical protein|nr:hypothetical protein [Thermoleophilaceae bacterium]